MVKTCRHSALCATCCQLLTDDKMWLGICVFPKQKQCALWKWTQQSFPNIVNLSLKSTLKWKVWEMCGGCGVVATQCVHSLLCWSATSFLLFFHHSLYLWMKAWAEWSTCGSSRDRNEWMNEWVGTHTCTHRCLSIQTHTGTWKINLTLTPHPPFMTTTVTYYYCSVALLPLLLLLVSNTATITTIIMSTGAAVTTSTTAYCWYTLLKSKLTLLIWRLLYVTVSDQDFTLVFHIFSFHLCYAILLVFD